MEKYLIFVLCVILSTSAALLPRVSKHYRTDYEYNQKTDAFYKLHIETLQPQHGRKLCEMEGAELMIPTSDHDITQLHSMFKKFPDLGDYVWVGDDGQRDDSAEKQPVINLSPTGVEKNMDKTGLCDVVTRNGDVESMTCYRELPFMCKVAAKDALYDKQCDVYAKDYKYYSSVGSCYKIPRIPFTWSQAYSECEAEGAHLLVINSEAEHTAIWNLTNTEPWIRGSTNPNFFLAGFRANKPTRNDSAVFKTIFNQTLEEAGYSGWVYNEPNNLNGREYCGCIYKKDGKLNDVDCSLNYGFICEKEVPSKCTQAHSFTLLHLMLLGCLGTYLPI